MGYVRAHTRRSKKGKVSRVRSHLRTGKTVGETLKWLRKHRLDYEVGLDHKHYEKTGEARFIVYPRKREKLSSQRSEKRLG